MPTTPNLTMTRSFQSI